MSIEIKRAAPKWAPQLAELDKKIFSDADWFDEDQWHQFSAYWVYVNGVTAGSVALCFNRGWWRLEDEFPPHEPGSLYIASTGLLPEFRGQGYGTVIKRWQIEFARMNDYQRIVSNCRASNAASVALNKKFGFELIDSIQDYYHDPNENAFVLELVL